MHELSVAEALLDHAAAAAADHDAASVEAITVELGAATHVNPTQLRFCIETVAEATFDADLTVHIDPVDPRATCECGWAGDPPSFEGTAAVVPTARCPECGGPTEFTRGMECRLASVTVPDTPAAANATDTED
ncbi:hydrogenase maturation nickel metallochaperone HypA [Haloplanus ruber]|uniref:Hydrogenase maturation nickel metallochaperone HypA n=1 Tax=Haloplanus ruber TaxID=869892 RepID=A0ABD6CTV3_9EURY|nr:hydrogenase maturation nickel metallochaperone HypA [Haloplanus ruber]